MLPKTYGLASLDINTIMFDGDKTLLARLLWVTHSES
jgi:hypothetical protein